MAALARLELSPAEEERFCGQLSQALDFIGALNELDASGIEPMSHALDISNVFRGDKRDARFPRDMWKANAPAADYGHFQVPKIIE